MRTITPLLRNLMAVAFIMLNASVWAADESQKLTGTPIGSTSYDYSTGGASTTVNTPACVFDGDFYTFYASYERSFTWVGLDLGSPHVITKVGWSPRAGQPARVQLAVIEASNSPDFLDAVPLYLIPNAGVVGEMHYADVDVSRGFRYVRYVGPNNARCNLAELEFYGYEGAGDDSKFYQITNLPTLSIHTYAGIEPYDKVNDLESNMTLVYDNGTRIQEYPITARLRGNASMGFPKKPYRIKFNDGKSHHMMKGSPLESPAKAKKWTLINNYGDKTLMRNILAFECSKRLGMPYTPYCQPVDVIMNGEYKGCYQLCDQITIDPHRVPITEMSETDNEDPEVTGGYLIEVDAYAHNEVSWFTSQRNIPVTIKEPDEEKITTEQFNYIRNYFNTMEAAVWSTNYTDSVTGYRSLLDVESFIRHFFVGEFSGNTDTYWSTYMYKDRGQSQFTVAPSWDFDLAFNNDNRTYPVNNRSDWVFRSGGSGAGNMPATVTRILTDPYVQSRMKGIWKEMRVSGAFSDESLTAYVDSMEQVLNASQKLNFTRWPILNQQVHQNAFALGSYEAEVDVVRNYLVERIAWIDEYLQFANGTILQDSTYYISTPEQLIEFASNVNKGAAGSNAYLMNNLDMQGYSADFVPIGSDRYPFHGLFDGQGHTISNLHISGANGTGLLGSVAGGVILKNIVLDSSCSITGSSYVGVVGVSRNGGVVTLEKVGNEANVIGTGFNVSGMIGCNYGSTSTFILRNCYNTGTIVGEYESGALSGWVGSNAIIENCYNIGTVSGIGSEAEYLYRGGATLLNTYSTYGSQGIIIDASAVGSGELCYKLNEGVTSNPVWRQTLGADQHPLFLNGHGVVFYQDGTYTNGNSLNAEMGDVNGDGTIDATDVNDMANYIQGKADEYFLTDKADVNSDKSINVHDLVQIINASTGTTPAKGESSSFSDRLSISNFRITPTNTKSVKMMATFKWPATALQADLTFAEGLTPDLNSFTFTDLHSTTHTLKAEKIGDVVRILAYSPQNDKFTSHSGGLLTFNLTAASDFAKGTIVISNQQIANASGMKASPSNYTCTVTAAKVPSTDIEEVEADQLKDAEIYTLTGVKVDHPKQSGIYIVNGNKVLIIK